MSAALATLVAQQRPRLVAHLARHFGLAHWALAEDAVQQACVQALSRWPAEGVPANAAGWLWRVAQREVIDQLRRAGRDEPLPDDAEAGDAAALATVTASETRFSTELDDDELALLFAACHPALPLPTQVALALRAATALELATIADGLLTTESALAQRLARARALLRQAELALPAGAELQPRRHAVLATLQLMFTLGMQAAGRSGEREPVVPEPGRPASGTALCWEAMRLARALAAHPVTAGGDAQALAALLLLHGARLTGRVDAHGDMVPLSGQPRDRWDASLVRLGLVHLEAARAAGTLSTWHLQAGIAAEHACAGSYAATDWVAITRYYEWLLKLDASPAPRLGHAIALAEGTDAARALQLLAALLPEVPRPLRAHTLAALARAHERLGEREAALARLREAIEATTHAADARLLQRRLEALQRA